MVPSSDITRMTGVMSEVTGFKARPASPKIPSVQTRARVTVVSGTSIPTGCRYSAAVIAARIKKHERDEDHLVARDVRGHVRLLDRNPRNERRRPEPGLAREASEIRHHVIPRIRRSPRSLELDQDRRRAGILGDEEATEERMRAQPGAQALGG